MEDFNFNNTSLNKSDNNSNSTVENDEGDQNVIFIMHVATCIVIAIGLPLILVAIYSLYSLVRKDHAAPIYVINLLLSDLIQLCSLIVLEAQHEALKSRFFIYTYNYGMLASVGFMVCIALERYLVITCPLWYRFRRTIKISVVVCVFVWVLPLVPILAISLWSQREVGIAVLIILQLLPFPLFIFFLRRTLKALSASRSVPTEEKRRIVGILVLVLLIYTLLFLPNIFFHFVDELMKIYLKFLDNLSMILMRLSPLADLVLYIFMRKGAIDKLLASMCCCRMDPTDNSLTSVSMMTTCTLSDSEREGERKQNGRKQENVNK